MTRRRALLIAGTGALAVPSARAQQAGRTYRIGWLSTTTRDQPYFVAMMKRLAELGFVEGRNLTIEYRLAPVHEAYEKYANELGQARCDLLFAPGNALALQALVQSTRDTPIVIGAIDYDPVAAGFVSSLGRPGGRITGISQLQLELPAKRLEAMRSMLPKLRRVGVLADASSAGQLPVLRRAASVLGLELVVHQFGAPPYDLPVAYDKLARAKVEALVPGASGHFAAQRKEHVELALRHRLPAVYPNVVWVELGGLMSYGSNFSASHRRVAEQMAQILGGANPAEMPIEQPSEVEMVINLATAKTLGITVPQSLRLRADRVIE